MREWGERVSRKRTIRLMQEDDLKARVRKRYKVRTDSDHDQPIADNLLEQKFDADGPNQRWVGDTSEFVIGASGKLYLAVILDLFSRFVVGWAVSAVNDRHLTIKALEMALKRRCPEIGLLHHSVQGSTYANEAYQRLLAARGIICSMSRRGNCYDAVMERYRAMIQCAVERSHSNCEPSCHASLGQRPRCHRQRANHVSRCAGLAYYGERLIDDIRPPRTARSARRTSDAPLRDGVG